MHKDYYQILGISAGADKKEIKKAYFKLVRQYPPEKEPERFQEIREAYENLMSQEESQAGSLVMEVPDHPFAAKMLSQIQELMRLHQYEKASRTAQEAIRLFGDSEGFLYYLALSQRRGGHPGKAARNLEELVKLYPDKAPYRRELAVAYMDRGYGRKAYDAFGKAYDVGARDDEFILLYAMCCKEREKGPRAAALLREMVERKDRNLRDTMGEMLEAYAGLFVLCLDGSCGEVHEIVAGFGRLIDRASAWLDEYEDVVTEVAVVMMMACSADANMGVPAADDVFSKLQRRFHSHKLEDFRQAMYKDRQRTAIDRDERLSMIVKAGYEAFVDIPEELEDDAQAIRYMQADVQLCLMEEWPRICGELEIVKEDYPEYYEALGGFLKQMENMEKVPVFRNKLLKEYDRIYPMMEEGYYYEMYPQKRLKTEKVSWNSGVEGTYMRQGRKIGRNDPCPCGSGKKYKNCCGKNQ